METSTESGEESRRHLVDEWHDLVADLDTRYRAAGIRANAGDVIAVWKRTQPLREALNKEPLLTGVDRRATIEDAMGVGRGATATASKILRGARLGGEDATRLLAAVEGERGGEDIAVFETEYRAALRRAAKRVYSAAQASSVLRSTIPAMATLAEVLRQMRVDDIDFDLDDLAAARDSLSRIRTIITVFLRETRTPEGEK